jgi:F0F1-type ATP synthase membrane subunit c/vacuolar-type H+-ATPase subunit K
MFLWLRDTSPRQGVKKIMDPNWIVAAATVVVAGAAIGSAIAAKRYADLTLRLILEQRESQLNDKFPCIVVRSRLMPTLPEHSGAGGWTLRLVNVGRGPAFIESFETTGLPGRTDDVDKVIGPDIGDPYSQVQFAHGYPADLTSPKVTIIIRYHDIVGRGFESGIMEGKPFFHSPKGFCGTHSPETTSAMEQ